MNSAIVTRTNTERASQHLRYSVLTMLCGAILVAGFFSAARQHFASMDYSIKNSRLRGQLNELENEKRRLLLAKEIALSPIELMKAAKRIGFRDARDANTGDARPKPILASATSLIKPADVIKKTVISNPTMTPPTAKPEKSERQAKKESASKDKKDRT